MVRIDASCLLGLALFTAQPVQAEEEPMRVLIYGDSNTWGALPLEGETVLQRLPPGQRFGEIAAQQLGDAYQIVIDGMPDRTTDLDAAELAGNGLVAGDFNGAARLPAAVSREMPLDLVVIVLGTNDLAAGYDRSAEEVATAAVNLAAQVESGIGYETAHPVPAVLLVTPPRLGAISPVMAELMAGADSKSAELSDAFAAAADDAGIPLLDASEIIGMTAGGDGIHLTAEQHAELGRAMAQRIDDMLGE